MRPDGIWRKVERAALERRFGIGLPWEEDAVVVALRCPGNAQTERAQWERLRGKCVKVIGPGVIRARLYKGVRFVAFRASDADSVSELTQRAADYGFEVLR